MAQGLNVACSHSRTWTAASELAVWAQVPGLRYERGPRAGSHTDPPTLPEAMRVSVRS